MLHFFLQNYDTVLDTITESWDPDAEARPSAHLIETRLNTFADIVDPCKPNHKEPVVYLSHQPLPTHMTLPPPDNPLPLTPSSSPCVTMSPSDTKTMPFDCAMPTQLYFTSSFHSVVDSGNISDEVQDGESSNTQYSPLSSGSQKVQGTARLSATGLPGPPLYRQNAGCVTNGTTINSIGQMETSI